MIQQMVVGVAFLFALGIMLKKVAEPVMNDNADAGIWADIPENRPSQP